MSESADQVSGMNNIEGGNVLPGKVVNVAGGTANIGRWTYSRDQGTLKLAPSAAGSGFHI